MSLLSLYFLPLYFLPLLVVSQLWGATTSSLSLSSSFRVQIPTSIDDVRIHKILAEREVGLLTTECRKGRSPQRMDNWVCEKK